MKVKCYNLLPNIKRDCDKKRGYCKGIFTAKMK